MDLYTIRRELMSGKTIYDLPLRVTYYSRVSTEKDEQKNSLDNQEIYYKNKILDTPMWTLVDGYSDRGITGTSTKKRKDFNEMISDGLNDMYDLILTKEVCRFARNTLDTLQLTRSLLAKGKGVYFELDNINTLEQEGELRLTIMASLAQDESRRISERVKFGFKRSIEKGRVLGNNAIWGYEKDNCKLKMNEDEAKIVKRIYEIYASGDIGIRKVGKKLEEEGILTKKGETFAYSTIKNILTNPKYKGCYCGKKTEVIDFMSKERIEIPKEEWITYKAEENIVPQIVNDDIWQKCNEIMEKRSNKYTGTGDRWNNQYQYSNLLICTNDGKKFWRRKHRPTAKEEFWICSEYAKNGLKNCNNHTYIGTEELNSILSEFFSELLEKKSMILKEMLKANSRLDKKDFKLEKNIKKYSVFARVTPEHKVRIVNAWQKNGEVVAMTGDGVNDSPALKKADIGCAMGIVGTDVAKEAADVILTDDNFATVVSAVEEGRRIYDNILKVIQFLLSSNVGEIIVLFFATLLTPLFSKWFGITDINSLEILLPIHILWINLVTDSLPALALAFDPANRDIMERKPVKPGKGVFTKGMTWRVIYQGVMIGGLTLAAFMIGLGTTKTPINGLTLDQSKIEVGQTMAFVTLALSELTHVFNVRNNRRSIFKTGIFNNMKLIGAVVASALLVFVILLIPGLREIFSIPVLPTENIIELVCLVLAPIAIVEIFKIFKINGGED